MENVIETKICSKCKIEKPATTEYFYKCSNYDKLRNICRQCHSENHKEWYEKNKIEKDLTKKICNYCHTEFPNTNEFFGKLTNVKSGLQGHCKTCHNFSAAKWREDNKDKMEFFKINSRGKRNEEYKKYRLNNYDKVVELQKNWKKLNKDKCKIYDVNREARKRLLPDTLTVQQVNFMFNYFNYNCLTCEEMFNLQLDHWIPLVNKNCPGTTVQNIVPLCKSCNSSKNSKLPEQWLIDKFGIEKCTKILKIVQDYFMKV